MPLTMLAWSIWFLGASGLPALASGPIASGLTTATLGPTTAWQAPATPDSPDDRLPLWCEAEDEDERDDDSESAAPLASIVPWPSPAAWSRPAGVPPRPTLRPRSGLRSPVLRC